MRQSQLEHPLCGGGQYGPLRHRHFGDMLERIFELIERVRLFHYERQMNLHLLIRGKAVFLA